EPVGLPICRSIFDSDIAAFDVAEFVQSSPKVVPHRCIINDADDRDLRRLLRACREGPCRRRAPKQGYQLSPSYIGHGLPLGTRCASLPHAEVAAEVPAGPWGRSELFLIGRKESRRVRERLILRP